MSKKDEMDIEDEQQQEEQEQYKDEGLDGPNVLNKYKTSAQIVNEAIAKILAECKPGKKVVDLCELGDKYITARVENFYKKVPKGVAFPTCVNVNSIVCHFSPNEDEKLTLALNDTVRIDLGVHIDGYIATGATTVVLAEAPVAGKAGDAFAAANTAVEAAMRLMKPGRKNTEVTEAIQKIAADYEVNPCEGVLSHQLKRFVIDGKQVILQKQTPEQQVDEFVFQENEVYSLDIVFSTGHGKLREVEPRTTIYKRQPENAYLLKRKSSRQTLNEITAKYQTMPFSVRSLDKKIGKMGIIELYRSGLVEPYPVLCEKVGETVVQIKTTICVMPSQVLRITQSPLSNHVSTKQVKDANVLALLKTSLKNKKQAAAATTTTTTQAAPKTDAMDVE